MYFYQAPPHHGSPAQSSVRQEIIDANDSDCCRVSVIRPPLNHYRYGRYRANANASPLELMELPAATILPSA